VKRRVGVEDRAHVDVPRGEDGERATARDGTQFGGRGRGRNRPKRGGRGKAAAPARSNRGGWNTSTRPSALKPSEKVSGLNTPGAAKASHGRRRKTKKSVREIMESGVPSHPVKRSGAKSKRQNRSMGKEGGPVGASPGSDVNFKADASTNHAPRSNEGDRDSDRNRDDYRRAGSRSNPGRSDAASGVLANADGYRKDGGSDSGSLWNS